LVLPQPSETQLEELFQRFEGETFGVRAGGPAQDGDPELEKDLSRRGLDAYQPAYTRYTFLCRVRAGRRLVTLLSQTLWPTEVIRRIRRQYRNLTFISRGLTETVARGSVALTRIPVVARLLHLCRRGRPD